MSEDTLLPQLNDLSLTPKAPKAPKVIYDEVALKERWKILGVDAEQSNI
jgi:hypothetical protein